MSRDERHFFEVFRILVARGPLEKPEPVRDDG
jgi:hypothetical protein